MNDDQKPEPQCTECGHDHSNDSLTQTRCWHQTRFDECCGCTNPWHATNETLSRDGFAIANDPASTPAEIAGIEQQLQAREDEQKQ